MNLGSWKIDDNLTFTCNTHNATTGAATDADSAPAYRVYEDETTTPLLTGTMALLDGSNTAGFYSEQIALSAANGFEKGKCYHIYISAAVSSVTGTTSRTFQIEAEVDSNRVNWANVDNPTTTVGLSGTTVKDATDVNTDTDLLLSRLGTPSNLGGGATVAANLSDIEGQTDDIGVAGAGLTDLGGMSTTMKAQVEAEVDDALGAGTGTALTAIPWNASWDAEVQSEVEDALDVVIADSVPADGSRPTVRQALLMITRFLMEKSVSSTTVTVKKEDGTTSSMTFTLDSATTPTSITRAS